MEEEGSSLCSYDNILELSNLRRKQTQTNKEKKQRKSSEHGGNSNTWEAEAGELPQISEMP